MWRVSGVSGQCRVIKSDSAKISAKSVYRAVFGRFSVSGNGSNANTRHPNAASKFATIMPIFPVPITPAVVPFRSKPSNPSSEKFPSRTRL